MVDLQLDVRRPMENVPVITLRGQVDINTAPSLRHALGDLIDQGDYHLIFDLSDVDYIDSTGLGVIVGGIKRIKPHSGSISVVSPTTAVQRVFVITQLDKIVNICSTEAQALQAISAPTAA